MIHTEGGCSLPTEMSASTIRFHTYNVTRQGEPKARGGKTTRFEGDGTLEMDSLLQIPFVIRYRQQPTYNP
jgi:hypothetical protein